MDEQAIRNIVQQYLDGAISAEEAINAIAVRVAQ